MSACHPEVFIDHELSAPPFFLKFEFWMFFLNVEAIFTSSISKFGSEYPKIDCDVFRSFTEVALSTSVFQRRASVVQPELEHTSVLKFVEFVKL